MNPLAKGLRFWHTVRHLKPVQVYGRLRNRLVTPRVDARPAPGTRHARGRWVIPARREQRMVSATRFCFLSEERDLEAHGWDDPALAKLWRYNLHYFDDLAADRAESRGVWHRSLIERWIAECPPGVGTAWEPYPISVRIVNWIKWMLAGQAPTSEMLHSLAVQARFLRRRMEWHLLGNHLFMNAKALAMAGLFFEGREADEWLACGRDVLRQEIPEQILRDGGQFERSPMYHAMAVEDMLDLLNMLRLYSCPECSEIESAIRDRIPAMLRFLDGVCHADGEVASLNDSAQGIAPSVHEVMAYASRLGFATPAEVGDGLTDFPNSGFVRVQRCGMVAILDVGGIAPAYLPGHAHAETLCFELSVDGRRILVNSGTSEYGGGSERIRQRGTAAHNTVTVDGVNSSDVWGDFRVGRRAKVVSRRVQLDAAAVEIEAAHDGYCHLEPGAIHTRFWRFTDRMLEIVDRVPAEGRIESHWHFAPTSESRVSEDRRVLTIEGTAGRMRLEAEDAEWHLEPSTYSPRFGVRQLSMKAVARFTGTEARILISF